jgi:hypothetical protein
VNLTKLCLKNHYFRSASILCSNVLNTPTQELHQTANVFARILDVLLYFMLEDTLRVPNKVLIGRYTNDHSNSVTSQQTCPRQSTGSYHQQSTRILLVHFTVVRCRHQMPLLVWRWTNSIEPQWLTTGGPLVEHQCWTISG